jgi:N-acetylneuraminate synthase/N,N'-diacetyllegionaminate synthase
VKPVKIGNKLVGETQPCFIIAEAGVNHNGDVNQAKHLIDAAKDVGADAIKFQSFQADSIVTRFAEKAKYQKKKDNFESQYDMLKKLELTSTEVQELFFYAEKKQIIFLSSPFDKYNVDLLDILNVPAFKIPSGEITNLPLLRHIALKRKPVIMSTGMSTKHEIKEAITTIHNNGVEDIILLYCVTSYPAESMQVNLRTIQLLNRQFKLPVGFSDHTLGITFPIAAKTLGAVLIEKHFTLNKQSEGPDHKASLEPKEFKEMVQAIRAVEESFNQPIQTSPQEAEIKNIVRRSIVASMPIPKGTVISAEMITTKRPGTGIPPKLINKVLGRKTKIDIAYDELIDFKKLV